MNTFLNHILQLLIYFSYYGVSNVYFHLPQDYNSVISLAANDPALIDSSLGNGVLKLPITAVSRDGALSATI